ncbi:hypothetical protein, partial [Bacillus paralicheniformis]|uniref:hypothetical protein n=2 Tax=Bacillus paralicheniformis TaxID=1648923 RepID=UPI001C93DAD3
FSKIISASRRSDFTNITFYHRECQQLFSKDFRSCFYKASFLGADTNITSIFVLHNSFFKKIIIK